VGPGGPGGEAFVPATLYCSLGGVTNLAIARDFACLFSRVAQFGVRDIAGELAGNTGLALEDAERWLLHAGLGTPLEDVGGDPATAVAARGALEANLGRLADELRLSLDYYAGQEGAAPVGEVVLCGWGSAIAGLAEGLAAHLGREVTVRRPDALLGMSAPDAARMTLPYGLALEH
jgi:Tfp pilus assembly PilM family ATPase